MTTTVPPGLIMNSILSTWIARMTTLKLIEALDRNKRILDWLDTPYTPTTLKGDVIHYKRYQ